MVKQFEVYLLNLDELPSKDAKNTRPAVVISPDEINRNVESAIVAPIASTNAKYPTRVAIEFLNSPRFVILDQIQTVDSARLVKKIGELEQVAKEEVTARLIEMFS